MTWQIFPNVTFTNGSKNIAVNDSTATAGILAGYAVNKDNKSYEIESITSSAIILVDAWAEATTANVKVKIQPTSEPIKEYIQETLGEVKGLVADYLARLQLEESIISSTGTVQFTDSAGVIHDIPGWGNLSASMLTEILKFGVGATDSVNWPTSIDDHAIPAGEYRAISANGGSWPTGVTAGILKVGRYNTDSTWQEMTLPWLTTNNRFVRFVANGNLGAWEPVWSGANYQPSISGSGLNVPRIMYKGSAGTVASSETIVGSSLQYIYGNSAGTLIAATAAVPPGVWRNVSGIGISTGSFGIFVRES